MSKTFRNYEARQEFLPITTRIREIIENQQFEGAASGFLQPNIIARKLGLTDRIDHTSKDKQIGDLSRLTTEELIQRAQAVKELELKQE